MGATCACILSSERSTGPRGSRFTAVPNAPLPLRRKVEARNFGILLSPDTFSARRLLTSELLRYL